VVTSLLLFALLAVETVDAGTGHDPAFLDGGGEVARLDDGPDVDAPTELATATVFPGRLRGSILAKGSRNSVLAAKVVAKTDAGIEHAAHGDERGDFDLPVPCGLLQIAVSAPGFQPYVNNHDACADRTPFVVRLLPRSNLPLYETVVLAPQTEPSIDLRGPEMTRTPGSLGDPFRALESLPGVAVVAWPAPIYAVRGANPGNTGFFLDEVRMPLLFHLALGPSVIHPYLLDSMAFYPGGYPASYGRFISGIVTAKTRPGPDDRAHGMAEIRLYDAGALAAAPMPDGNGSVVAAFRYSYTGALLSLLRNDIELTYWDYQLRAERRVGRWKLGLLLFGAADDLDYQSTNRVDRVSLHLQFHRASLRASTAVGQGQLRAHVAFGADESSAPLQPNYTVSSRSYSILPRLTYERKSQSVDFSAGVDGHVEWLRPTSTIDRTGTSDLASNRLALLAAGFVSAEIRTGERVSVTPGLRLDSYTIGGTTKVDLGPRLAARLGLAPAIWLVGSGGRFSQAPDVTLQIPAVGNFGLARYGLQSSWQGALGILTQRLPAVDVELTGFVQRYVLTDLRDPTLASVDPTAGDFLVQRYARSYGIEVMIRRPASERLHGWLTYTLSKSERAIGAGIIAPSDWDQRHILNAVLGYRLGLYTLGVRGHYHSGRPVLLIGVDADAFVRVPPFYQLDLRVERRIVFDAFTLEVYAEIVNATLSRETYGYYQAELNLPMRANSMRLVLPSLGIRAEL
jgi:hypothetical protein